MKEHKDIQQIKKLLGFGKFSFISLLAIFSFVYLGCKQNYGELDTTFKLIEKNSPNYLIKEFKNSDLDSVIIYNSKYNLILVDAVNKVMKDSIVLSNVKSIFETHEIPLVGKEVKWTFIAAFHKYLNKDTYNIPQLLDRMIEMSDSIYEVKNGHLRKEINPSSE